MGDRVDGVEQAGLCVAFFGGWGGGCVHPRTIGQDVACGRCQRTGAVRFGADDRGKFKEKVDD